MKNQKKSKSFQLNSSFNYYMGSNNVNQIENDTYNLDYVNMDDNIDFEKDEYFDKLKNNKKYY